MKSFTIEVKETLSRVVEVNAENEEEAIEKVRNLYRTEEIILDSEDYVDTEIFPLIL